jgi:hypothetical protein
MVSAGPLVSRTSIALNLTGIDTASWLVKDVEAGHRFTFSTNEDHDCHET